MSDASDRMLHKKSKSISKSSKCGLVLPISRVESRMKATMGKGGRVAGTSPIYMTACLEYIAAEVLEAAAKVTAADQRKRISPADLVDGIRSDVDLARVFADVEVVVGEQLRGVHAATTFKEGQDEAPAMVEA